MLFCENVFFFSAKKNHDHYVKYVVIMILFHVFIIYTVSLRYSPRSHSQSVSSLPQRSPWYAYLYIPHNTSEEEYAPAL